MSLYTIAFYNLENLFDTIDDPKKLDDDFTPGSNKKWDIDRFQNKIRKLGNVISLIGKEETNALPVLVGVAEVENNYVLKELVNAEALKQANYKFIHFDAPDERGIDTALLYRADFFNPLETEAVFLPLVTPEGHPDLTRDILHVYGELMGQPVHILVNHWPSRRAGANETAYRRMDAAKKNREIIAKIVESDPQARIIIMGDFNDDHTSESVMHLVGKDFYNPMHLLLTREEGSLNFRGQWNLFDQMILSANFMKPHQNPFAFKKAGIFNDLIVQEHKGKYKGNPFRTYAGDKYLGGVSDHFPVYGVFEIK